MRVDQVKRVRVSDDVGDGIGAGTLRLAGVQVMMPLASTCIPRGRVDQPVGQGGVDVGLRGGVGDGERVNSLTF